MQMIAASSSSSITDSLTPSFGGGNVPGNRNFARDNPPSTASTSLYLYVFFAVLVIVVCSCSTLMARSFIQRRHHRRLIEESIRNGTWIPPNGGLNVGVGRGPHGWNVDMSKKPEIWEMFITGQNTIESSGPGHVDAEWDWDSIKPLSATTGKSLSSQRISLYNSVGLDRDSATRTNNTTSLPTDRRSVSTLRYLGMANPLPPLPESNTLGKSSASPPKPQSITVATLITMPSQDRSSRRSSRFHQSAPSLFSPKSHSVSSPSINSDPSVIPVTSLIWPIPSSSSFPQQAKPPPEAKVKGLPPVEFGIVELPLRDRGHKEDG